MPGYFAVSYQLNHKTHFLIWFEGELDGVLTDDSGKVLVFVSLDSLIKYAQVNKLSLSEEKPTLHNLDKMGFWVQKPTKESIDCVEFLNVWNLFTDIAKSIDNTKFDTQSDSANKIYDKLFWGNNLPSVTPIGKSYEPVWSDTEVLKLQEIMVVGLELFQNTTEL